MALPHSRVMIHQPMGGAQGQAEDIKVRQGRAGSGGCGFATISLLKESTYTDSKHVCPRKKKPGARVVSFFTWFHFCGRNLGSV